MQEPKKPKRKRKPSAASQGIVLLSKSGKPDGRSLRHRKKKKPGVADQRQQYGAGKEKIFNPHQVKIPMKITTDKKHRFLRLPEITDIDQSHRDYNKIVVLALGSSTLKIGLATAEEPTVVPCCVAVRLNKKAKHNHSTRVSASLPKVEDSTMDVSTDVSVVSADTRTGLFDKDLDINARNSRVEARATYLSGYVQPLPEENDNTFFENVGNARKFDEKNCTTIVNEHADTYWTGISDQPAFITGSAALRLQPNANYRVDYPLRRGHFNITKGGLSMQSVKGHLERLFRDGLKNICKIQQKDWSHACIGLVIPDQFTRREIYEVLSILYDNLGVMQVFLHRESVCSAFGTGIHTAIVVDIGAQTTNVSCVWAGSVFPGTDVTIPLGGDDVDDLLAECLTMAHPYTHFCPIVEQLHMPLSAHARDLVRRIKHESCSMLSVADQQPGVLQDSKVAVLRCAGPDNKTPLYQHQFNVSYAAFLAGEVLLNAKLRVTSQACVSTLASKLYNNESLQAYDPFQKTLGLGFTNYENGAIENTTGGILYFSQLPARPLSVQQEMEAASTNTLYKLGLANLDVKQENVQPTNKYVLSDLSSSIPDAILRSVQAVNIEAAQAALCNNILLVGGGALLEGIGEALEDRLIDLLPNKIAGIHQLSRVPEHDIKKDLTCQCWSWKGMSILSLGATSTRDQWYSKQEWDKYKLVYLQERTGFAWPLIQRTLDVPAAVSSDKKNQSSTVTPTTPDVNSTPSTPSVPLFTDTTPAAATTTSTSSSSSSSSSTIVASS